MLRTLNGQWHTVYTSLTIAYQGNLHTKVESTEVLLHQLEEHQLQRYHQTFQHADKAGGYAIQDHGHLIISHTHGSLSNVIGLPIEELSQRLQALGFSPRAHA